MKIYWSAFLSLTLLLILAGCGSEQFGTTPQSNSSQPDAVQAFQQATCSNRTLIHPEVDILYVVDNSGSNYWISSQIKATIQNTITSISNDFDYRVIGTQLLETAEGDQDYQILAKDPTSLPSTVTQTRMVSSAAEFSFFSKAPPAPTPPYYNPPIEMGLKRVDEFIAAHSSYPLQSNGIFRQGAHLIVILISNGKDYEIETLADGVTPGKNIAAFNARKNSLMARKTYLGAKQIRLFTVTANVGGQETCGSSGFYSSKNSYGDMSTAILAAQGLPLGTYSDHYDLCPPTSIASIFAGVNSTIQKITIPHTYDKWPITFNAPATGLNTNSIQVLKSSPTQAPTLVPSTQWTLVPNTTQNSIPTRILPSVGEPSNDKYLVQFNSPADYVVYPECIQITSTSNLEYFQYVVIPKIPKLESVILKIRGQTIPQSNSNGWSYAGLQTDKNIKVAHAGFSELPAAKRTGYFIQLNGSNNYYKSGENVEIYYVPATN